MYIGWFCGHIFLALPLDYVEPLIPEVILAYNDIRVPYFYSVMRGSDITVETSVSGRLAPFPTNPLH